MQLQCFDWLSGHGVCAIIYHGREIATIKLSSGSCKAKSTRFSNIP